MKVENITTESAVGAIFGAATAEPTKIGDTSVIILPEGFAPRSLEEYLPEPTRKRGTVTLRDAASFITLVMQEAKLSQSRIYGCYSPPSFKAVFNDHGIEGAGWRDHVAVFVCPLSIEWLTWTAASGKQMPQSDFAAFIENNLPDIATPPAAEMLEISRSLEAKKKVNFASGVRLSNGQNELTYEEEISGTAAKGKLQVPEQFTIGIPVLEGGDKYAVDCRLRYRILDGGKMSMWYELVRPHKVLEDAVKGVWSQIQDQTSLTVLNGSI